MNLARLRRTSFPAPSPEERKANIAALKWALFDIFKYEPHSEQLPCHLSDARNRMWIAGTRGGKSRAAGEEAVPYIFAGSTRIWIVGQNYNLTEKEFRYVFERMTSQEVLGMFGGVTPLEHAIYNESQGNMYIRTKWGAEVECISLERPGGAFGEEVDLIVMSEASQIKRPRNIFERILKGRLATRLGDVIIPTTPAGRVSKNDEDGWLYDMYMKGYDPDELDYFTREWPSWANPTFREDPYELRRTLDPKIFAEQYEGRFVIFTGAVYGDFSEWAHVIQPFVIPKHWYRYEAIDPGFRGEFAWLSAVISEAGNVYIVDEYSDQECLFKDRVKAINDRRCEQYGVPHGMWETFARKNDIKTILYIDPEDPQCIAELMNLGLPGLKANNNVMVGVDRVQRRLKWSDRHAPSLYVTSNCVDTIECFKQHSWGEKSSTDIRKPANDKWKHKMDCARYICAGNLVASPPAPIPELETETLYEMIMELSNRLNKHPHELTQYERMMGGIPR